MLKVIEVSWVNTEIIPLQSAFHSSSSPSSSSSSSSCIYISIRRLVHLLPHEQAKIPDTSTFPQESPVPPPFTSQTLPYYRSFLARSRFPFPLRRLYPSLLSLSVFVSFICLSSASMLEGGRKGKCKKERKKGMTRRRPVTMATLAACQSVALTSVGSLQYLLPLPVIFSLLFLSVSLPLSRIPARRRCPREERKKKLALLANTHSSPCTSSR